MGIPAVTKPHSNRDVSAEWLLWSRSADQCVVGIGGSVW